jgi:hypothetical protein
MGSGSTVFFALTAGADLFAVGWMGMWLAASVKNPARAVGLTVLIVLLLPKLAFCIPTLAIDVGFILWAREKLHQNLRGLMAQSYSTTGINLARA